MKSLPPLPKLPGNYNSKMIIQKEYSYSDIINFEIKPEEISYITISKNDLKNNLDVLKKLITKNNNIRLKFLDWESVCYIDTNIDCEINNNCYLIDDGLRILREYIDLTKLKNIKLTLPLTYLMWGIKFENNIDVYCFQVRNTQANYLNITSINGNKTLTRNNLENIRKKIIELKSLGKTSDSEAVLLISDFIQSQTQYIDSRESQTTRGVFITPDFPEYAIQREKSGLVETVLMENYGVCIGISNLSTLLLNNPEFNIEVETVSGCLHAWNKVLIDGKYYYFDNTWNITRTTDPCEDGIITLSFCNKYNLFGKQTALDIGHHNPESIAVYNNGVVAEEDYQNIKYNSQFTYCKKPIYKSYKK